MEKILRINMSAEGGPEVKEESLGQYAGLGGRAMTSSIISREVPPLCHPLGAENKLVIAPGLLSGTGAAMSGRISVGCKSPLTGGIKEANAGGQPAQVMAKLGYAAIVLEGKPRGEDLYKLFIHEDGVRLEIDNSLKMLPNYSLIGKMKEQYGDKIACISIGPAGEMKMAAASVACTDLQLRPSRHAGRGGVGAVMGAKGIKVIVLNDDGLKVRQPKFPEKFREANRRFVEGLAGHPVTGKALPAYGTNVLTNIINEAGAYPAFNFKNGRFEGASRISGETFAELGKKRGAGPTHACHRGCVIRCSGIFNDEDGKFLSKQPEYETVWAHGSHCGIDDPDAIAKLDYLDDNYGLDTIEIGAAIGVAMQGGVAEFGNTKAAIDLVHEVGKGTPLGRVLGAGAAVTGKVLGVEKVPVVKGQALPAYDPRTIQGIGVTYATSPMGADHTAGYAIASNILKCGGFVDPLKPEGQTDLSRNLQIATAAIDSTGMCLFIAFALLDHPDTFQALLDLLNSFYGLNLTGDSVIALGKTVLSNERDFNARAGFTKEHDRLPRFFSTDPVSPHNITFMVGEQDLDSVFGF
jgi:aldehyde:ferredoxin oxidoreductase